MNSREFYNELKHLTELGYLEQTQLDRIQDEYIKTRKERRNIFLIFALLGVIFIGAGVISVFAYNWSIFSREMKAVVAFLPLLGVQGVLYWKVRAGGSDTWIKSLTLALGIAFLSALGLIYQAYQISCSLQSMMLIGFLVMLPVVYLLDGYYLAVLYMAGICWAGWNSDYTLLILLLLPYYKKRVKSGENCEMLSVCFFIWLLYLAILYVPYGSFYACVLILLVFMTVKKPAVYRKWAGRLIYVMMFFKAVFYSFFTSFTELFESGIRGWNPFGFPEFLLLVLLAGTAIRIFAIYKKRTGSERLGLLLYGIICGLLVSDLFLFQDTYIFAYEVLVNLCFIAFSLYKLLCGVRLTDLASVRRYTAALILYIVLRVCLEDYQLLAKGIVFLAAGLAFLAVNYMMTLKLKGGNTHEDKAE